MTLWLVAQIVFALSAWYLAGRAVIRVNALAGLGGRELARLVRALRAAGRVGELPRLADLLGPTPFALLVRVDVDREGVEALTLAAQATLDALRPPTRMLRALATVGTTLGLLAAVATLHRGLALQAPLEMQRAAARAFDCAAVGFATALPCWTAAALCRQRLLQAYRELDAVLLALGAGSGPSADGDEGSEAEGAPDALANVATEPVDGGTRSG